MTASTLFFLVLVLACPLMMIFMMRGGHGHGGGHAGHGHGGHDHELAPREGSTAELRRQRDDLDRLIEEREQTDSEREPTPTGWGPMSVSAASAPARRGFGARLWGGVVAVWAVVTGLAPHVLHHVGPLAGAALLAGFGGNVLFFALGLVLSLPMLRRLYRRFGTFVAPALAVIAFAGVFSFSSLVIAPRLTSTDKSPSPVPGIEQPTGHESHHSGAKP